MAYYLDVATLRAKSSNNSVEKSSTMEIHSLSFLVSSKGPNKLIARGTNH